MTGGYTGWSTFDATRFRDSIRFVMTMGEPPVPGDRVSFRWEPVLTATGPRSGDGIPFDPAQTITSTTATPVGVPCSVEYVDATGEPTPFGSVVPSRVKVWLLDTQYDTVKDADYIMISGDRYNRDHELPSYGLFSIGLHAILYSALNET